MTVRNKADDVPADLIKSNRWLLETDPTTDEVTNRVKENKVDFLLEKVEGYSIKVDDEVRGEELEHLDAADYIAWRYREDEFISDVFHDQETREHSLFEFGEDEEFDEQAYWSTVAPYKDFDQEPYGDMPDIVLNGIGIDHEDEYVKLGSVSVLEVAE